MKKVTIYSTPTCGYCKMTKEFLGEKGVAFEDFDVASDMDKRQEMIDKTGQMGVPVIVVEGSDPIVGFDKEALTKALGISA